MEQVQDTQEVAQEAQQAPVTLTLQDMKILAGAVELGAQRGAYRANEMEIIGSTYNKLANFLKTNAPVEAQPEATPASAEGEAPVAEVTESAEQA
jgi:hypothetical protein